MKTSFLLLSFSSDRSFTPTHHSYYSPKHEGMMEEMLNCQQVHNNTHTGGDTKLYFCHAITDAKLFVFTGVLEYTFLHHPVYWTDTLMVFRFYK